MLDRCSQEAGTYCLNRATCRLCCIHQWAKTQVPGLRNLLSPLEMAIHNYLIPAIACKCDINNNVRDIPMLPSRLGGLSMTTHRTNVIMSIHSHLQSLPSARSADHSSFTFPTSRNLRKAEGMQEGKQSREEPAYGRCGKTTAGGAASSTSADDEVGS